MTSEGAPDSAKSGGEALVMCLQRIAHHHRAPATLQSLTAGLPTTLNDFTPDLLVRAAKRAGLKARLQSLDIQSIPESALPALVLLVDDQCLVLESVGDDGSVSVYRPEVGSNPVVMSWLNCKHKPREQSYLQGRNSGWLSRRWVPWVFTAITGFGLRWRSIKRSIGTFCSPPSSSICLP